MKQQLLTELLKEHLTSAKVGILVKGIGDIDPVDVISGLARDAHEHLFASAVGYDSISDADTSSYSITSTVEKAVLWRSMPKCAGKIITFVRNDTDKLHSLAEFEVITLRDLSKFLIAQQIKAEINTPTLYFWEALMQTSDYYPFDMICDFVESVKQSGNLTEAIPANMWRLNLLKDSEILGTKYKPEERLARNRELIFAIGQLSEESRKKLSRAMARATLESKGRLRRAYTDLQNLYKYGKKETLEKLDFSTVQELFSATKKSPPPTPPDGDDPPPNPVTPIRPKEMNKIVADVVVNGSDEELEGLKELLNGLKKHFDPESAESVSSIPTLGGAFEDREIVPENAQSDLRKFIGKVCNSGAWGGLMETDESVLRDAITADIKSFRPFDPESDESMVAYKGGIDGNQALFHFIERFDEQFSVKGLETLEYFKPIVEELLSLHNDLLKNLDIIMYYPVLSFGADETVRTAMIEYIKTWAKLYHAFTVNEPTMRQISAGGTSFVARAILLLDVLYVKTPKEWKAILLPTHPLYLWRFYEVFRTLPSNRGRMDEDDAKALTEVLNQLPQIMSFVIANSVVTESQEDKVLPCSGNIEMLPSFENKTNRYLGDDGTESIGELLTRWAGFAPYTRNEVRICSVDAPDLIGNIRAIKDFMDNNGCRRVVYDVYLTRKQNSNNELSQLDYSGKDYEIGEFIRKGRIAISIRNVSSANDVKDALAQKPVHVAFYFDQSTYTIEYGPNSKNLYINPLVITYDYNFDEIEHRGSIFPSSDMDSGLVGDYHKLMRSADVISNNMNPRPTYYGNADMTAVVSTIQDGQVQWLIAADRDTNNYEPQNAIPIGEVQYDKRVVNVWTSVDSRIITQYLTLLRGYNLYPQKDTLTDILRRFGHISSNGLISIPKFGVDAQTISNKKKGLLGTLFAASWYTKKYPGSLVASLDDSKARLWLHDSRFGSERADLVALRYDPASNTLFIQPIEVKTRDDSPDAVIVRDEEARRYIITGHASNQIAAVVGMLKDIFAADENSLDMFSSARREVLKYQIVTECFRSVHDAAWQQQWCKILKQAFGNGKTDNINISVSGLLIYIKLSEASGGQTIHCVNPEFDDCPIEFRQLTAKEIQEEILKDGTPVREMWTPDFDDTIPTNGDSSDDDAIIDHDGEELETPESSGSSEEPVNNPSPQAPQDSGTKRPTITENGESSSSPEGSKSPSPESISVEPPKYSVPPEEIELLVKDFKRSCYDYHIALRECNAEDSVVGPSVIRLKFRLGRGQSKQGLVSHLEDIGREMKRSGVIIQDVQNSDQLLLDVPRLHREKVLFSSVIKNLPKVTSPEQLYFPLGRTPNGRDLFEDLSQMPHMLVGGSTGSGKSVFLFTMLASFLMTHPKKEDLQLILSSSKLEDFIHFEGLPHLYSASIISDATEATRVIKEVIFEESERRGRLLAEARVANIIEYNRIATEKLAPIVIVIDEFADLADQLESKKEQNAFYKPVQRIAQTGRSRGIHLVICTQRPEAKLVPSTTKAQLNGRVALRVNDGISSRMIIEEPDAQYLQKHGDMIYRNGDTRERAQGYLIQIEELDKIVSNVINSKY